MMPPDCWAKVSDIRPMGSNCLPFEASRDYARSLNLTIVRKWYALSKAGNLPANIPTNPDKIYRNRGWTNWEDFLGKGFLPFEEARAFARGLGLKNDKEWREWRKLNRSSNIPTHPDRDYRGHEWKGCGDFLGTGNVKNNRGRHLSDSRRTK